MRTKQEEMRPQIMRKKTQRRRKRKGKEGRKKNKKKMEEEEDQMRQCLVDSSQTIFDLFSGILNQEMKTRS